MHATDGDAVSRVVDLDTPEHAVCSRVMAGYADQINALRTRAEAAEAALREAREVLRLVRTDEDGRCTLCYGLGCVPDCRLRAVLGDGNG